MRNSNSRHAWIRVLPALLLCAGLTAEAGANDVGPAVSNYIEDRALKVNTSFSIGLSSYFSGSGLTYSVNDPSPDRVTTSVSGSTLTVTARSKLEWTGRIVVTATDSNNLTTSQDFNVYVYSTSPADVNLSVSPSSISEGASNTKVTVTAAFTSNWLFGNSHTVSVTLSHSGGVEVEGKLPTSFDVTIPAGDNSRSRDFWVDPTNDNYDTSDGTVTVSGTTSETGMDVNGATVTLKDDDAPPSLSLSVSHSSISEGADSTEVTVTARHQNATRFKTGETVRISASDSGEDVRAKLSPSSFNLSFLKDAASGSATFFVDPTNDNYATSDGSVSVRGSLTGVTVDSPPDISLADDDPDPVLSLSVSPSSISEGADSTEVTVTATHQNATRFQAGKTVRISVSHSGGVDATLSPSSFNLSFPKDATSASADFDVDPTNDKYDTGPGKVKVSGSLTGVTVTKAPDISLTDNDPTPSLSLSVSPSSISEGAGKTKVTVTARHKNATRFQTGKTVRISASHSGGVDATLSSASFNLSFSKDSASATASFYVTPDDDDYDTSDGEVSVSGSLTGVTVDSPSDISLDDNDPAPSLSLSVSPDEIDESAGKTQVTVTARHKNATRFQTGKTVSISASHSGGVGATLSPASFNLSFSRDSASGSASFYVTPTNDNLDTSDGEVSVSGSLAGVTVTGAKIILDNDDVPSLSLSVSPSSISEGAGKTQVTVTARHKNATRFQTGKTVSISASRSGGVGATLSSASFNLSFPKGAASATATFDVTPKNDNYDTSDGKVSVSGTLTGVTVTKAPDLSLDDNDDAPSLSLSVSPSTISEGAGATSVTVTARHKNATRFKAGKTVSISASHSGGVGATLSPASSSLIFPKDAASADTTFTVTPTNDNLDTSDGKVTVTGSLAGVTVTGAEIILADDETLSLSLSVSPSSISEGADSTQVTVTATHKSATRFSADRTVTVSVSDSGGVGATFSSASFDLSFPKDAASATATFTVTPTDDNYDTSDGKVFVTGDLTGVTVTGAEVALTDDDAAPSLSLSVSPSSISEGADSTQVTVTATHKNATRFSADSTVDISVSSSGGVGAMLSPVSFNLSFPKDSTSAETTFDVTPRNDDIDGDNGTVTVTGDLDGVTVTADVALIDDDTRGVDVSPSTLEVAENGGTGTYDVRLTSEPTASTVTVAVSSSAATAATVDKSTLTFTSTNWNTAQKVTVTGVNDDLDNAGDSRKATISNTASGGDYVAESASVAVTVKDDDAAPAGITLSASPSKVSEGAGATTVTVTAAVSNGTLFALAQTVTVAVAGTGDSTRVGFTAAPDTVSVTIAAGASSGSATFTLTPASDNEDEGDETVTLSGTAAPSGAAVTPATIALTDDDVPSVTIAAVSDTVSEGSAARFTLKASPVPVVALTVNLDVRGGGGFLSGAAPATATVAAGADSASLSLSTTNDAVDEPDDAVIVTLKSGTGYAVGATDSAAVTIADDDAAPAGITLSASPSKVSEGAGATTVTVTATVANGTRFALAQTVTVAVAGTGDSTRVGFTAAPDTVSVTIAAGASSGSATFTLTPASDNEDEGDETVTLSGTAAPSGAAVTPATIALTDDDVPSVTIAAVSDTVSEGSAARFTLKATPVPVVALTVNLDVRGGGGFLSGAAPATATVAAGADSASLSLSTTNDAVDEPDDDVIVTLKSGTGYAVGAADSAAVTIADDDTAGQQPSDAPGSLAATPGDSLLVLDWSAVARASGYELRYKAETAQNPATWTWRNIGSGTNHTISGLINGTKYIVQLRGVNTAGKGPRARVTGTPAAGAVPTVSISALASSVSEGASAAFTLRASSVPSSALTVKVGVSGASGFLKGAAPDSVIIAAGTATGSLSLATVDDRVDEPAATVTATLKPGAGYKVSASNTARVTVNDDDAAPTGIALAVSPSSISEGAGATTVTVTAEPAGGTRFGLAQTVTVTVAGSGDSTRVGFSASPDSIAVTIAAGAERGSGVLTVTPVNDGRDEADETVAFTGRASPSGATVSGASLVLTDDDVPSITISAVSDTVTEGTAVTFDLKASLAPAAALTVNLDVSGGAGFLSGVAPTAATIAAGATTGTLSLPTVNDSVEESDGAVRVTLKTGTGYAVGAADSATVVIEDDEPKTPPSEAPGSLAATPGDSLLVLGWTAVPRVSGYELRYKAENAQNPATWTWKNIGSGTSRTISGLINGTKYIVQLRGVNTAGKGPRARVTGTPAGGAVPAITISAASARVTEGAKAAFTLRASSVPSSALTVKVGVSGASGFLTGVTPNSVILAAGTVSATMSLGTANDVVDEPSAVLTAVVKAGTGYTVGAADTATVTIEDDDAAPTGIALAVSPSTISEGAGATKVTVTASATGGTRFAAAQTVAITVAGSGKAKTVGYAASRTSFNVTIAAGAGSAADTLMVTPVNDGANTDDETIAVSGSALPSSAVVSPATLTLTDDDIPAITIAAVSDRVSEGASAAFTLTATPAPARALTVGLSGSDPGGYLSGATPTSATIAAGSVTGTLSLATVDDKVDEENARVTVAVLPGAGYTVGAADTAWVTIEDDEPSVAPTASPGTLTATPGNSLLVLDWSAVARAFSYELRYKEESEQNPATWIWQNTGAATSHTISNLVNGRKYIAHVRGVNAAGKGPRARVTGTPAAGAVPAVTISAVADTVSEGTAAAFTLRTSAVPASALTVTVEVSGGAGFRSGVAPGSVIMAAGTVTGTLSLATVDDRVDDPDAAVMAVVKAGTGYTVGAADTAAVTISDDDAAPTGIALAVSPAAISEGAGATSVTVTASPSGGTRFAAAQTVAVTVAGSGKANVVGYAASRTSFSVTIAEGAASGSDTLTVSPANDGVSTGDETITVSGSAAPSGASVASASLAITDDDATVITVSAVADTVTEGTAAAFAFAAAPPPAQAVTVNLAVSGASGFLGGATPDSLVIAAGAAADTLRLTTVDDAADEAHDAVTVTVKTGTGYDAGATASARIVIRDDDLPSGPPTAKPANVLAAPRDGSLYLNWSAVSLATGYQIRYRANDQTDPPSWQWKDIGNATSRTIGDLTNATKYIVHLRAVNEAGTGPMTRITATPTANATAARASAAAEPPAPPAVVQAPAPVTLEAGTSITLDLAASFSGDALGYAVRAPDDGVVEARVAGGTLTIAGRTRGQTALAVSASNDAGSAGYVLGVTVTAAEAEKKAFQNVLAAMGRSMLSSVHATLGDRFSANYAEPRVALAGRPLDDLPSTVSALIGLSGYDTRRHPDANDPAIERGRAVTGADLLRNTSFSYTLPGRRANLQARRIALWGTGNFQRFGGAPQGYRYDGDVKAGYLGVDVATRNWISGVSVAVNASDADYDATVSRGALKARMTSVYPYFRWRADGRPLEVWSILGVGTGTLRAAGPTRDLSMRMGMIGLRAPGTSAGGLKLDVVGHVGLMNMAATAAGDADAVSAGVQRLRLGVEASHAAIAAGFARLTPFAQLAARFDGGDGETGRGIEVAGGLRIVRGRLGLEARGRLLATHTATGYEERGFALIASMHPGTDGTGLSISVAPRWGADTRNSDMAWREEPLRERNGPQVDQTGSIRTLVGYRMARPVLRGLTMTPFGEMDVATAQRHRMRLGTRMAVARGLVGIEVAGERRATPARPTDHSVGLMARVVF